MNSNDAEKAAVWYARVVLGCVVTRREGKKRMEYYVCYIFMYKKAIIGTAIWSSPVAANRMKDGSKFLELRRLALSDFCPRNTASYIISLMTKKIIEKFPDVIKLISYQSVDNHLGTIYKASNWTVGGKVKYKDWSTKKRKRNPSQILSDKIRWEYLINKQKKR